MPGTMPEGKSAGSWRPKHDCQLCRLGELVVSTVKNDVRGFPDPAWKELEEDDRPWVKLHRTNVVQGDGPVPCPVMLIGEAPGFHEDRDGLGFRPHAPAGRVLQSCLEEVGLYRFGALPFHERHNPTWPFVYVTNALKCRPVDNKIDKFLDCLEFCRTTFLEKEIAAVRPKVIVLLGKSAAQPYFGKESSLILRQEGDGPMLIHAPHPSYIARGAVEARVALIEALKLAKEVGYGA